MLLQPLNNTELSSLSLLSLPPNQSLSLFFSFSSHFPKFQSSPNPRRRTSFSITVRASSNANARAQTAVLPNTAIQRIAEKLRTLGFADGDSRQNAASESSPPSSVGEIFVPQPSRLPRRRVGETIDASWSSPENPVPAPGTGAAIGRFRELKREVRKEKRELAAVKEEKGRLPSLAELTLPPAELRRLRTVGIEQRKKLKVGKAGVTEGIVNGIHERWRRSEVVRIECEDICRANMKRTHDLLEKKTGGLVVWRAGSKILLYRGTNYLYPYFLLDGSSTKNASDSVFPKQDTRGIRDGDQIMTDTSSNPDGVKAVSQTPANKMARPALIQGVGLQQRVRFQLPGEAQIVEEADRLLDGLGPRFNDWWGYDPQPVDADLLPPVVHGYRRPFRLLPYGMQPKLTNDEMTRLRRLARPLACHFALGRNRNHQGLASSIVKLWEKCEVAKIAVKRGVQNTNSEIMAEELKSLTGATLLSRDREFITLYRGKDFLPLAVSSAIEERRKCAIHAKKLRSESSSLVETARDEVGVNEPSGNRGNQVRHLSEQKKIRFTEASVKRTSTKLSMALEKKEKTEKLLAELEKKEEIHQQPEIDKESINSEERYMLKKIGLRMKPFLLLGRRGIFDGTIENMHLHWKYRELVKIIADEKSIDAVHQVAQTLEAESGGILVAVERVSKGHAIIVYRGKNYIRPASLRPETLLNKKAALKRSIEAQRRESLKLHVLKLDKNIEDLKSQLVKDKEAKKRQPVDKTSEVQEEANVIQPTEGLRLDHEVESLSPSASTTSLDEIAAFREISSSAAVGAQPVGSGDNEAIDSSAKSDNSDPVPVPVDEGRTVYLSNKERLLLRKQALKMRYRPVLAVGRSNIITGVARTIKAHFKKYPLAIVNVKGRAKGTSVQEVIFMLEQATGGVLVSQEPSKVILYRGWGAEESPDRPGKRRKKKKKSTTDTTRVLENKPVSQPAVSPEILDAIRTECGLQNRLDADKFP